MSGNRYVPTIFTALDLNGDPIPGAKLYFYVNETVTPKDTYSDIDLTVPNDWPVLADTAGRFTDDMFLETSTYRIVLTDSDDVVIWDKDDCNTFNGTNSANAFPFAGAVIEFYGTQDQLDVATASLWYLMDGNNSLPNLNNLYIKTCISVATIGGTGGAATVTPTGTVSDHTLTIAEMPAHTHQMGARSSVAGAGALGGGAFFGNSSTDSRGGGDPHSHGLVMDSEGNEPPYYTLIKLVYLGY